MKSRRRPDLRDSLRKSIERELIPTQRRTDSVDSDLGSYIAELLSSFSEVNKLEKIDLLTQEGAQKALEVLDDAKENLDVLLRQTHALQSLLTQRKMDS